MKLNGNRLFGKKDAKSLFGKKDAKSLMFLWSFV